MPTVSLSIIAKNASKTFEKCLSSFSQISDEIVIVDTGSTDDTFQIARKYTNKIYNFKWIDDFAAARNFALSKCTCDFWYWLDSDDFILPEDIEKFKKIDLTSLDYGIHNYAYARDEFGNVASMVPRERLFRRSMEFKWKGRIHEHIELKGHGQLLDLVTYHDKQQGSSDRNLKILEEVVKAGQGPEETEGDYYRYIYYLGREYYDARRHDEAVTYLNKYLERKDLMYWEDLYQVHYKLALCYFEKKDGEKIKHHIYESLKCEDRWAEPYYLLGLWYMNQGDLDRAIQWYENCLKVKRPSGLLTSYIPEYYTWLPNLNLTVCYANLKSYQKAFDCNQEVLKYRPGDDRAINNDKMLREMLNLPTADMPLLKDKRDGQGKKLNLGCGNKPLPDYINVDIFDAPHVNEKFNLYEVPYQDGTISAIYSEHSLEHVPFYRTEQALKEWFRVLQPGGELLLRLPDFELCCKEYLKSPANDKIRRQWYKYTIFGLQTHQFNNQPDDAEIHRSGYSKKEMGELLESIGYVIDYLESYNGFGTPSIGIRALKPINATKIAWIVQGQWDIDDQLRAKGYRSRIVGTYSEASSYDVIVVNKAITDSDCDGIKMLKSSGKRVYCYIDDSNRANTDKVSSVCDVITSESMV